MKIHAIRDVFGRLVRRSDREAPGVPEASSRAGSPPLPKEHRHGGHTEEAPLEATSRVSTRPPAFLGSGRAQPGRRPFSRRSVSTAAAGLAVGLVVGFGALPLADKLGDADDGERLSRYMARAAIEWATIEQLLTRASMRGEERYRCESESRRLDSVPDELEAIGAPDDELAGLVRAYVDGLSDVSALCATSDVPGREVAQQFLAEQSGWARARVRALELGWDGPCALQASIAPCRGQ